MSANLEPINPLAYIAKHMPTPERGKNVDGWFKNESMELNFGDYVGRPNENVQVRMETLPALFQQGWFVTAVKRSAEDGEWEMVSTAESSSFASSRSDSAATSHSSSSSSSNANSSGSSSSTSSTDSFSHSSSSSGSTTDGSTTAGHSSGTTSGSGNTNATGSNSNSGSESSGGVSDSKGTESSTGTASENGVDTERKTDPYWCAYSLIRLERRRMQADAVLQSMVDTLVRNFNEGRKINVERYDELVALYALMLSRTENEANGLIDTGIDFTPLFKQVKSSIENALREYKDVASAIPSDWLNSRKDEINRRFDQLVSEAKSQMISNGTYNGTVWPTTMAGIERDRQNAINALKDESVKLRLEAFKDAATITASVQNEIVSAQVRIFEALQKQKLDPVNLRNTVFKWMLDFMEKRTDEYPGIDQLATVAERLGYAGGIAFPK